MELTQAAILVGTTPFDRAVQDHYAGLVRRLTLIVGDPSEAQDLAQTTYLRAFRDWSKFDGADVRSWLYTTGIRLAIDELRRRRRWFGSTDRCELSSTAPMADADLAAALATLEPRSRAALILNVLDGYSQAEIAALFRVPPGTVASWIARAKHRLAELLVERE